MSVCSTLCWPATWRWPCQTPTRYTWPTSQHCWRAGRLVSPSLRALSQSGTVSWVGIHTQPSLKNLQNLPPIIKLSLVPPCSQAGSTEASGDPLQRGGPVCGSAAPSGESQDNLPGAELRAGDQGCWHLAEKGWLAALTRPPPFTPLYQLSVTSDLSSFPLSSGRALSEEGGSRQSDGWSGILYLHLLPRQSGLWLQPFRLRHHWLHPWFKSAPPPPNTHTHAQTHKWLWWPGLEVFRHRPALDYEWEKLKKKM